MRYILLTVIFLNSYYKLCAQDDTLRQVIKTALYDKKVFDKIFIDYRLAEPYMKDFDLLPEGKYAFIYPGSIFQQKFPGIMNKLYQSFDAEGVLLTITYIKEENGTVFITDHKMDSNIELLIMFEKIFFSSKKAELVFHTTSWRKNESMTGRYVNVSCTLVSIRNEWRVRKLKIKEIECCDDRWGM